MTGDKWTFNSSAAEQTNAWLGGYLSILHEMHADLFSFYLDEMIRRRNDWTISGLDRKGHHPRYIHYEQLLPHIFE